MDPTPSGVAGRLAAWGGVAVVVVTLIGGIASMARQTAEIQNKLDRNCRILATLDQDLRLHILVDLQNDTASERAAHTGAHRLRSAGTLVDPLAAFPEVSC